MEEGLTDVAGTGVGTEEGQELKAVFGFGQVGEAGGGAGGHGGAGGIGDLDLPYLFRGDCPLFTRSTMSRTFVANSAKLIFQPSRYSYMVT